MPFRILIISMRIYVIATLQCVRVKGGKLKKKEMSGHNRSFEGGREGSGDHVCVKLTTSVPEQDERDMLELGCLRDSGQLEPFGDCNGLTSDS